MGVSIKNLFLGANLEQKKEIFGIKRGGRSSVRGGGDEGENPGLISIGGRSQRRERVPKGEGGADLCTDLRHDVPHRSGMSWGLLAAKWHSLLMFWFLLECRPASE
jgi:hypothetical protein